jgi:hypothetical protein
MWLPKDERCLLTGYYRSIRAVGVEGQFGTDDFAEFLHCQSASHGWAGKKKDRITQIAQAADAFVRGQKANKVLHARGLINYTSHQTGTSANVSLTLPGYDLGRRYSNWFIHSGLWFNEYRKYWFWLIPGGAICMKLFDRILALIRNT